MTTLGFYVAAPQSQCDSGSFGELLTKESIIKKVEARVGSYASRSDGIAKATWFEELFLPTFEHIVVGFLSWESIVSTIVSKDTSTGQAYAEFYARCLDTIHPDRPGR